MEWKIHEDVKGTNYEAWVEEVCEEIAEGIKIPCKDHILVCSGGPYRMSDVSVTYNEDKKEIGIDLYSPVRMQSYREMEAKNYAKGLISEACITRAHLMKKHPKNWKEKFQEWKQGMYKLAKEEQMDMLKDMMKDR
jgi:hypothetical protein